MSGAVVRIATRASRLALWQAHHVAGLLESAEPGLVVELVEVSTEGDRDRVQRLDAVGGRGASEGQACTLCHCFGHAGDDR